MIRKLLVYVAGPYSSDPEYNTHVAMDFGSALIRDGRVSVVIPHLNHFMHMRYPEPYETWMEVDFTLIERCNLLVRLPGHSPGADREVAFALGRWIPVVNLNPLDPIPPFPNLPLSVIAKIEEILKEQPAWF